MTSDAIQLPDAPGIPGLRFRHFRGGRDFHHMATITRASAEVDGTERADTPEELEKWFAHLTNCDPYTDMIFAEVDPGEAGELEVGRVEVGDVVAAPARDVVQETFVKLQNEARQQFDDAPAKWPSPRTRGD